MRRGRRDRRNFTGTHNMVCLWLHANPPRRISIFVMISLRFLPSRREIWTEFVSREIGFSLHTTFARRGDLSRNRKIRCENDSILLLLFNCAGVRGFQKKKKILVDTGAETKGYYAYEKRFLRSDERTRNTHAFEWSHKNYVYTPVALLLNAHRVLSSEKN